MNFSKMELDEKIDTVEELLGIEEIYYALRAKVNDELLEDYFNSIIIDFDLGDLDDESEEEK